MTPYLLVLAVLLGIAPGLIAHGKGRNFLFWWIYGVFLGPIALLHAILLRPKLNPYYDEDSYAAVSRGRAPDRPRRTRGRFYWPMALLGAASVAIAIVAIAGYGILSRSDLFLPFLERDVAVSADRTRTDTHQTQSVPAVGSQIAELPAAERPKQRDEPPTVRVTVRNDSLAPAPEQTPEQLARAPAMPVERVKPQEKATDAPSLERTTPRTATQEPPSAPTPSSSTPSPTRGLRATPEQPAAAPPAAVASLPATAETVTPPKPALPKPARAKPSVATAVPTAAPPTKPARPAKPATQVTAIGETVQIVQLTLAKKGYDPGPANGRAGIKTQTAIKKFQTDRGLRPTGAIDYDLLEKLGIVGPRVHAFRPPPGATPGR